MTTDDTIVSFVTLVIASAFLMAGIGGTDAASEPVLDAGCTAEIVTELSAQGENIRVIVEQTRRARGIVEAMQKEEMAIGR